MRFFKKEAKTTEKKIDKQDKPSKEKPESTKVKVKKKTKIGFRYKKDKTPEQKSEQEKIPIETIEEVSEFVPIEKEVETTPHEQEIEEKKSDKTKKKKTILKKDLKGKPVFLEDTGEKLGIVFDNIYDKDNVIVGYKIKDGKSDAVLSFPTDQFDLHKDGLIFVPGWYTNALKTIEKLEFKDKISPELTALLSDDSITQDELYYIFVKHDDEMVEFIDNAKALRETLTSRLKILEKQRLALKDDLMDLTEKRLIRDIDRRQFSEDVMQHRRKVNILDININKCKDLLNRLDNTSFGSLGKKNLLLDTTKVKIENNLVDKILDKNWKEKSKDNIQYQKESIEKDSYKEKYLTLKEQYNQLEENYLDLKIAVDRLFNKKEI
jgi:hypothetical protein